MNSVIEMDPVETAGMSPRPHKEEAKKAFMNFYDAMKEVAQGKKVTRADWQDANIYGYLVKDVLHIRTDDKTGYRDHQWLIALADMIADDWVVLD